MNAATTATLEAIRSTARACKAERERIQRNLPYKAGGLGRGYKAVNHGR